MKHFLRTKGLLFDRWWENATGDFDLAFPAVGGGFLLPIVAAILSCVLEPTIGTAYSVVLFFGFFILGMCWCGFCIFTEYSTSFKYSLCPTCNIAVKKDSKCPRCHGVVK